MFCPWQDWDWLWYLLWCLWFYIPSKRRTRESHEGNACKETQPILQEGVILGYHVLKKRVSDTCTRRMVSRPALKHSCDQCEPWFPFPGIFMNHKESSHKASKYSWNDCDNEAICMEHCGRHCKRAHENRSPRQECDSISVWNTKKKIFKCHIESKHDGPRYPCKDCEAPLNAEAILKCDKCEHTLGFRTLMLKHTHDDIRNT